jgi:3,4-dihydroxy 2-butanone 4-phosphate synthase/GTP cyclohydrolase II
MNEDGSMARVPDLAAFSERHGLVMVTVADLIRHRMRNERLVQRIAAPNLPTRFGEFRLHAYRSEVTNEEAVALAHGEIREDEPVLVRVHSQCLTGDASGPPAATADSSSPSRWRRSSRPEAASCSTSSRRGAASA